MAVPTSRADAILQAKINGETYDRLPLSRIEEELLELDTGGGGGGGTNDYNKLINRPYAHDGSPLQGDISDEIDASINSLTAEQKAHLSNLLEDD